jgi:hypothetical protein
VRTINLESGPLPALIHSPGPCWGSDRLWPDRESGENSNFEGHHLFSTHLSPGRLFGVRRLGVSRLVYHTLTLRPYIRLNLRSMRVTIHIPTEIARGLVMRSIMMSTLYDRIYGSVPLFLQVVQAHEGLELSPTDVLIVVETPRLCPHRSLA